MKKFLLLLLGATSLSALNIYESGWWTGPIFAPHARVLAPGMINLEPYIFYNTIQKRYNNSWEFENRPRFFSVEPLIFFAVGITDWFGIQGVGRWFFNDFQEEHASHTGDANLQFDFQILRDTYKAYSFDLLFYVNEIFPTGNYRLLRPSGADSTGLGGYFTAIGFNSQKIFLMNNGRLIRVRAKINYTAPSRVHVLGRNTFGGGAGTNGHVWISAVFNVIFGYEVQLTQNWVFAFDYLYEHRGSVKFKGTPGLFPTGIPSLDSISVAPAIEYNFSAQTGLLAGVWVSLAGRNSPAFLTPVIALNLYF